MHKRVKVCIRVRPNSSTSQTKADAVLINKSERTVSVVTNATTGSGTCFHFDQVLDAQTTQSQVFQAAASEVVENVLSGYNGTILAYGQTGAGKTFTMSGGKRQFEDRGICARAISSIFQRIQQDNEHCYAVRVSYVEVYNENLYDLLQEFPESSNSKSSNQTVTKEDLVIQENSKGQTFIKGLTRPLVKTEDEALDLLFQGETNRIIAEHCLNAASTRSHCIFTIYLERKKAALVGFTDSVEDDDPQKANNQHDDVVIYSKLHLVDLAGSERMKKTNVSGMMLKEASHINRSLTFLEQVVIALGDKKRSHIPYRQTTLTNLLKDSLGGNCRTLLIACIWPDASHNDQSIATLKFATRMMRVKISAIINVAQPLGGGRGGGNGGGGVSQQELDKHIQEIKRLKEELAMHDTLNGKSFVEYDSQKLTTPAKLADYRQQVQSYLEDSTKMPPIVNLLHIQQLLRVFRDVCLENYQQQTRPIMPSSGSDDRTICSPSIPTLPGESKMVKQFRALRGSTPPDRVKLPIITAIAPETHDDEENESSRNNNLQNQNGSATHYTMLPPLEPAMNNNHANHHTLCPTPRSTSINAVGSASTTSQILSDKELFDQFKQLQGVEKPESLLDLDVAKQNLRQGKAQFAALGLELNKLKLEIDGLSVQLQDLRRMDGQMQETEGNKEDEPSVMAQNTMDALVMQLKDAKKRYRERYEKFQEKKAEVTYLTKVKDQILQNMTREFEMWKHHQQHHGRAEETR